MSGDQSQVRPDGLGGEPTAAPASEASGGAAPAAGDVPADACAVPPPTAPFA